MSGDYIVVRYGELTTKGKNKKDFIRRLDQNIRDVLRAYMQIRTEARHDRLFVHLNGAPATEVMEQLQWVFGISSFSLAIRTELTIEAIQEAALREVKDDPGETFKVIARRQDKRFMMHSDAINRAVAGVILDQTDKRVDVHTPEIRIRIEVRGDAAYVMTRTMQGALGYPVGMQGKVMHLLSGGIDSPVAAWLMMKRGVRVEAIHFASPPYTSDRARDKVMTLAGKLTRMQGSIRVHVVPFTAIQSEIYAHADESYAITLMRRMMVRIAVRLAQTHRCLAISTGDSLGQVASQTLNSLDVIGQVSPMQILRPLISYDKTEIMDLSRRIGTYETSILPYEDCCTIFDPKNPVTRPKAAKCVYYESHLNWEALLDEAVAQTETVVVRAGEMDPDAAWL